MPPKTLFSMLTFHSLILFFLVILACLWRRPQLWLYLLTSFVGEFVGLNSVWTNETIVPVFLLLAFSALASFVHPSKAWLLAGLMALWIPLSLLLAMLLGAIPLHWAGVISSCFAFVPAGLGGLVGIGINRAAGRPVFHIELASAKPPA